MLNECFSLFIIKVLSYAIKFNFLKILLLLGLSVLKDIESVVKEEMNKSQTLELLMPLVQPANLWKEFGL